MKIATTFLSAVASAKADHRSVLTILRSRSAFILIALALGAFAFAEKAQAISPPPDGGYPNGNTAEGQATLFSLTTGTFNTAVGFFSLRAFSDSNFNTGVGAGALLVNTATGATSNIRFIVPELDTEVNSIVFNLGASRFTIALQAQTLTISGEHHKQFRDHAALCT